MLHSTCVCHADTCCHNVHCSRKGYALHYNDYFTRQGSKEANALGTGVEDMHQKSIQLSQKKEKIM